MEPGGAAPHRARHTVSLLVVEDDADARGVLCELLDGAGYCVGAASDGSEALARLLVGPLPDLMLLDLRLPVMDGWGLMAQVKARPALAAIPVVVMTGAGQTVLNLAPVSAGYLRKPLKFEMVLETIKRVLWTKQRYAGMRGPGDAGEPRGS